jgi:hypothetical protein
MNCTTSPKRKATAMNGFVPPVRTALIVGLLLIGAAGLQGAAAPGPAPVPSPARQFSVPAAPPELALPLIPKLNLVKVVPAGRHPA